MNPYGEVAKLLKHRNMCCTRRVSRPGARRYTRTSINLVLNHCVIRLPTSDFLAERQICILLSTIWNSSSWLPFAKYKSCLTAKVLIIFSLPWNSLTSKCTTIVFVKWNINFDHFSLLFLLYFNLFILCRQKCLVFVIRLTSLFFLS